MNVNAAIRNRMIGTVKKIDIDFTINKMRLQDAIRLKSIDDTQEGSGPLACVRLDKSKNNLIAVANEGGSVDLLQTTKLKNIDQWLAHDNAIFDIKTTPDSKYLLTASGDKTIKIWDVESKKNTTTISPHFSSIKSISVYDQNIVASGSRDGCIKIHDLRSDKPTKIVIRDAHRNIIIAKPRRNPAKTDPISCVTNVVFDNHMPRIYSAGANDATIKLWDLRSLPKYNKPRRLLDGQKVINQPYITVKHPSHEVVHCGYSHLILSANKLYAACSDNKIYCYQDFGQDDEPIKFVGFEYDTYLKMALIDDRFLVSGAKRGSAIVWSLGNMSKTSYFDPVKIRLPIGRLKPDFNDEYDTNVIETDWNSLSVLTFRDDRLVCKWTMNHVLESDRKRLFEDSAIACQESDVTIEMSDVMDMNVLRPNCRINMNNT